MASILDALSGMFGGANANPQDPQAPQGGGFRDTLGDIGIGLMMSDPNYRGVGQMMAMRQQSAAEQRQQSAQANQTVGWLTSNGVGQQEAEFLARTPEALKSWYSAFSAGQKPDWQITDMYDDQGRKIKAMVDKNTGQYNPIGGAESSSKPLMNAGDGRIYDPNNGKWISAPDAGGKAPNVQTIYDQNTGMEKKVQWNPQTNSWDDIGGVKAPSGTQLSVDPTTGAVTFQQGSGLKPLTEGQSKDAVFATRAEGALNNLNQFEDALTSFKDNAASGAPVVGNYLKSEDFQKAEQAGREFLQAILRKDTGAAITKEETEEYGNVYLPRPGDSTDVIAQKRLSRQRALEALKSGMPPQAILQSEQALKNTNATQGSNNADPLGIR